MNRLVSSDVLSRALAALERDADLDDVVIMSSERLGQLIGVSNRHANEAIHHLIDDGRIARVGVAGRGSTLVLRLEQAS